MMMSLCSAHIDSVQFIFLFLYVDFQFTDYDLRPFNFFYYSLHYCDHYILYHILEIGRKFYYGICYLLFYTYWKGTKKLCMRTAGIPAYF